MYQLVKSQDPETFEAKLNAAAKQGWVLVSHHAAWQPEAGAVLLTAIMSRSTMVPAGVVDLTAHQKWEQLPNGTWRITEIRYTSPTW